MNNFLCSRANYLFSSLIQHKDGLKMFPQINMCLSFNQSYLCHIHKWKIKTVIQTYINTPFQWGFVIPIGIVAVNSTLLNVVKRLSYLHQCYIIKHSENQDVAAVLLMCHYQNQDVAAALLTCLINNTNINYIQLFSSQNLLNQRNNS